MTNLRKRVERLEARTNAELNAAIDREIARLTPEQAAAELAALLGVFVEQLPTRDGPCDL